METVHQTYDENAVEPEVQTQPEASKELTEIPDFVQPLFDLVTANQDEVRVWPWTGNGIRLGDAIKLHPKTQDYLNPEDVLPIMFEIMQALAQEPEQESDETEAEEEPEQQDEVEKTDEEQPEKEPEILDEEAEQDNEPVLQPEAVKEDKNQESTKTGGNKLKAVPAASAKPAEQAAQDTQAYVDKKPATMKKTEKIEPSEETEDKIDKPEPKETSIIKDEPAIEALELPVNAEAEPHEDDETDDAGEDLVEAVEVLEIEAPEEPEEVVAKLIDDELEVLEIEHELPTDIFIPFDAEALEGLLEAPGEEVEDELSPEAATARLFDLELSVDEETDDNLVEREPFVETEPVAATAEIIELEQAEDTLRLLADKLEEGEPKETAAINESLNQIGEVLADVEVNDEGEIENEEEIQLELEDLVMELFESAGFEYEPTEIANFTRWIIRSYVAQIESEADEDEPLEYGTHEILNKLLLGLGSLKKAMSNAGAIGKSAMILCSFRLASYAALCRAVRLCTMV